MVKKIEELLNCLKEELLYSAEHYRDLPTQNTIEVLESLGEHSFLEKIYKKVDE